MTLQQSTIAIRQSSIRRGVCATESMQRSLLTPNHIRCLFTLLTLIGLAAPIFGDSRQPNVLFIAVDDLRTELGCYGADHVQSPNIDQLASEGVLFQRAYCQFALCNPSRTSLMTGMRPDHVGVVGNHTHFRDRFPHVATLPQHFRQHGYRSVGVGKLYHGPFPKGASKTTWDTVGDFPSWSEPPIRFGPRYYFSDKAVRYAQQAYREQYNVAEPGPEDWTKKLVFGYLTDAPDGPDNLHYDGKVADAAIEKLRELKDDPFFLAVGFIKPHSPWVAPKKYFDLYDRQSIPLAANGDFPENAPQLAGHDSSEPRRYPPAPKKGPYSEEVARELRHGYFACVSFIDAQIGRLLSELKQLGLDDNTIVVLWGDHGYHLGEQSLWGKSTCFENAARVPLIVRAPDQHLPGAKSSALVELVDLYPTLCKMAGLALPPQIDGESFRSVVLDPNSPGKRAAFSQYPRGGTMGYSVRTDRYRFTRWQRTKDGTVVADELYDHLVDPLETRNLASATELAPVLAEHAAILDAHQAATAARSLPPRPRPGAISKPDVNRPTRVACVGDSITFGSGIDDPEKNSFPAQLQHLLGDDWQVRNFGFSGATLLKQGHKPYWEKPPFQPSLDFQPDVVVINLGANDAVDKNWQHRADFVANYRELIEIYRNLDSCPQVFVCDILPMTARHERYDECMPNRRELRPMIWELATELDVPLIDLHQPFEDQPGLLPDGLHPDQRGAQIMAGHVFAALTGKEVPAFALLSSDSEQPVAVWTEDYMAPLLVGARAGPLRRLRVEVADRDSPISLREFHVTLGGSSPLSDLNQLQIYYTGNQPRLRAWETPNCFADATEFATANPQQKIVFQGNQPLTPGTHYFWIAGTLKPSANIDHVIVADCEKVVFSEGTELVPQSSGPPRPQRLGVAVRRSHDDGVHTYRIPGLATTNEGTLVAVYDIRRQGAGDLPGDIDIGMSRSTDGGRNWEPMQVIMDMGDQPEWEFDGIGDPSVLVDKATNTIWVAAVWSHGERGWSGSQPGMEPADTGQFMLVRSDDDGRTWSKPINITAQIKKPEWCFLLQGPGKGITMQDGTLVFPAQFQDTPDNQRLPRSTIIYSRDHGATWQIGTGAFDDTTEAQVVEVEPGVLMLNCRYNREPRRVVMTTSDMGQSWTVHPTSQQALVEPRSCMASLIHVGQAAGVDSLLFSNPNSTKGRHHMTIKASGDKGLTWPEQNQLLLDEGNGAGYSCLTMIDKDTVGILYEGSQAHMVFQRIKLRDLLEPDRERNGAATPRSHRSQESRAQPASETSRDRPNVLLIVSEDNGPELGCYGDPFARTPNLDQLAAEGVLFQNAFVTYSVCSPSRASIFTGLYPHQNGQIGLATHKFSMYGELPNMVSLLKEAGYRTGIIGKIHVNPESAFPCDFRAFPGSNFNNRPVAKFAEKAATFMSDGGPFFLMVNFPDAHFPLLRQQHGLPAEPLEAADVKPLPWVGVDSPRLRQFTADYYNCLSRLDSGVGMLLEKLVQSQLADNTLVIYLGDHGAQFSRGKTSVYEAGLKIPLIIRSPGTRVKGTVRDEFVSIIDLLPTVLDWTGLPQPTGIGLSTSHLPRAAGEVGRGSGREGAVTENGNGYLPGRSLRPLLEGQSPDWRENIFAFTTGSAPALYFPQFSVRDKRYKLIVSPLSLDDDRENACAAAYLSRHNVHFAAGCSPAEIAASDPYVREAYRGYLHPPEYELYDLQNDPHEFHNLAELPEYQDEKQSLLATFTDWRTRTHEPLARPDVLTRLTAEHDRANGSDYRHNNEFRWQYLDYFAHELQAN